ncbi:hypothetical protein OPT61_g947 [Boeremia exigua]|uniref:Uncharacterized protein n=1 Tax=Boeremia exigua TaxID=749465 RepID=A0ACC2IRZ9_9PLEO|nr:hypothetical protein OPT61_g947 [Boeremia exigua]
MGTVQWPRHGDHEAHTAKRSDETSQKKVAVVRKPRRSEIKEPPTPWATEHLQSMHNTRIRLWRALELLATIRAP